MKLIVGLGNDGAKYDGTRHNMGFEVIDELAVDLNLAFREKDFKGIYAKGKAYNEDVILLKPLTYMNLSGESVKPLMRFFKISIADLLVICDDLAMRPGAWRAREKGASGGQKGLQNIIEQLGSSDFKRVRIGIGEPPLGKEAIVDYVLGKPNVKERTLIDNAQDNALKFLHIYLEHGFQKGMDAISTKLVTTAADE